MPLLTTAVVAVAVVFGVAYLLSYFAGPWLVTHVYETSPLPNRLTDELPPDCPKVLVVDSDSDGVSPASGSGRPGSRRLVVNESVLNDRSVNFGVISRLAVAEFDSHAYDLRVFANLLRFELLFGTMAFFFWSAEADLQQSIMTAAATIGGVLIGIVVVFYVLYRAVASRIYVADASAARTVGTDALVSYIETESQAPDSTVRGIIQLRPSKSARISQLE